MEEKPGGQKDGSGGMLKTKINFRPKSCQEKLPYLEKEEEEKEKKRDLYLDFKFLKLKNFSYLFFHSPVL